MRPLVRITLLGPALFLVWAPPALASGGGYAAAIARTFRISPEKLLTTIPPTVTLRVNQRGAQKVGVKLVFTPVHGRGLRSTVNLGRVAANRTVRPGWPTARQLSPGRYRVRLAVSGANGAKLARSSRRPGRTTVVVKRGPAPVAGAIITPGAFPLIGAHGYGGSDGRFGAQRDGHLHEGQDLSAASGTPIVSPIAGKILFTDYQAGGAGYYVVMDAIDGRSFMFAHLLASSTTVLPGQMVVQGQSIGKVGQTGSANGPHLHFEIWINGWRTSVASQPVDPLPQLLAWDPDY